MLKILIVGIGGFLGSVCRYIAGIFFTHILNSPQFPFGTFAVNIIGCFLIGLLGGIYELRQMVNHELRLFLITGFLGGFTTFSAFGYETFTLINDGKIFMAGINIVSQLIIGLAAVWFGYRFSTVCL